MPHAEESLDFTPDKYPSFPSDNADFPTVKLETISLKKLEADDPSEKARAFEAFKTRGFVYLELAGTDNGDTLVKGADEVGKAAARTFALSTEEKEKYRPANKELFGYKMVGATNADKSGTPDTAEFFNISKNDMIVPDSQMARSWPPVVLEHKPLFAKYSKAAHATGLMIMDMLSDKLGIDREDMRSRHKIEDLAGDHIRMTRGPPRKTVEMPEIQTPSHTDFGTITILMNWLGGLQVWSESARAVGALEPDVPGEWLWVAPKRGCAIVNLGDAAVKYTNGVLCSGRHRVIPSPGEQGKWPRYSIVYFVRPADATKMEVLKGEGVPAEKEGEGGEVLTAKDWIYRQAMGLGSKHLGQ